MGDSDSTQRSLPCIEGPAEATAPWMEWFGEVLHRNSLHLTAAAVDRSAFCLLRLSFYFE